ncbi:MAG: zf-HC2 domain-containing protein, partial [Rhodothermales bacterium]|nr:zf-HC2 domain-containing protein [Rhodothermales bacterium]
MEQKHRDSACPISQMSFGDISRYLQGGFEPAVRKAVAAHVVYCNACREELERVKALRKSGRHMMISNLRNEDDDDQTHDGGEHVQEVALAAFIDNGLTGEQRNHVTEHVASCHDCYVKFSALQKELSGTVPQPLRAPASVVEALKKPVPTYSPSLDVAGLGRQIIGSIENLLGLRWTQPALAFATGVLVMLMFLPSSRTVIPLPGVSPIQTSFDDKVRS